MQINVSATQDDESNSISTYFGQIISTKQILNDPGLGQLGQIRLNPATGKTTYNPSNSAVIQWENFPLPKLIAEFMTLSIESEIAAENEKISNRLENIVNFNKSNPDSKWKVHFLAKAWKFELEQLQLSIKKISQQFKEAQADATSKNGEMESSPSVDSPISLIFEVKKTEQGEYQSITVTGLKDPYVVQLDNPSFKALAERLNFKAPQEGPPLADFLNAWEKTLEKSQKKSPGQKHNTGRALIFFSRVLEICAHLQGHPALLTQVVHPVAHPGRLPASGK